MIDFHFRKRLYRVKQDIIHDWCFCQNQQMPLPQYHLGPCPGNIHRCSQGNGSGCCTLFAGAAPWVCVAALCSPLNCLLPRKCHPKKDIIYVCVFIHLFSIFCSYTKAWILYCVFELLINYLIKVFYSHFVMNNLKPGVHFISFKKKISGGTHSIHLFEWDFGLCSWHFPNIPLWIHVLSA